MSAGREGAAKAERRAALLNGVGESGAADGDDEGDEEGEQTTALSLTPLGLDTWQRTTLLPSSWQRA